ncbi:hypothetical protein NW762_006180 [Fusarium torreyae]|uniref:Enoyl reductase (ER) domain-containing protein n=1 Tax=Fusarium torreyae TaxID=1237075 RepID=A0A9W8VFB6_9HYPO|nr:hypothetical protein NW762_006180 [Fusarium torreyae]
MADTMKCVVLNGPFQVSLENRPIPQVQDEQDIVVKVSATALCGSDLHLYRGHMSGGAGFIMGHEFTGTVVSIGSGVKTVQVGDRVVSAFTTSCGECFYCRSGCSARCVKSLLFGTKFLDGGQAEYVRVPSADGTVIRAPDTISDQALILMADIFPTGYFGVKAAVEMTTSIDIKDATVVVIGCGPVGLCAVIAAANVQPKHLFAIDSVPERLKQAQSLGATPLNFLQDKEGMHQQIKDVTEGRGADIVIEVVGQSPALRTAFDLLRPSGTLSSIGVHNGEIPWNGYEAFSKNIRLHFGRCPVRSVFPEALALLQEKEHLVGFMFENVMPLSEAVAGYDLFVQSKVQKVMFRP